MSPRGDFFLPFIMFLFPSSFSLSSFYFFFTSFFSFCFFFTSFFLIFFSFNSRYKIRQAPAQHPLKPLLLILTLHLPILLAPTPPTSVDLSSLRAREEQLEKFMQELYKEITTTTDAGTTTFAEAPSWTAAAEGSCLRWNGWEIESCGSAVSESGSKVMAGVEYTGKMVAVPESKGRCGCKCGSNGGLVVVAGNREEGGEINSCGGYGVEEDQKVEGEDEEEWFEREGKRKKEKGSGKRNLRKKPKEKKE